MAKRAMLREFDAFYRYLDCIEKYGMYHPVTCRARFWNEAWTRLSLKANPHHPYNLFR